MGLVTDVNEARAILRRCSEREVTLPAFNTENADTTEAIFRAVSETGKELNLKEPPVIIGVTNNFFERNQLVNYTPVPDSREGFLAFRDDVLRLTRREGPYSNVKAMVFFDHAQYDTDMGLLEEGLGFFVGAMYHCTWLPVEENTRLTKEFVRKRKDRLFIEGSIDELIWFDSKEVEAIVSDPAAIEAYVKETGIDLVEINLGTQHQATEGGIKYDRERAQKVRNLIGNKLVVHGSSSLDLTCLETLPRDGVVKVNAWTNFEKIGAQAIARDYVENLDKILPLQELKELNRKGIVSKEFLERSRGSRLSRDLMFATHRRDDVWMLTVVEQMKLYMRAFGYGRLV